MKKKGKYMASPEIERPADNGEQAKEYTFTRFVPGGNETALVMGISNNLAERKRVNDEIMKAYPSVEQVGFASLDTQTPQLIMAGGEFCGNATRSTTAAALQGQKGEVMIQVSGVQNRLRAGVTAEGEAYSQMPIYPEVSRIIKDGDAWVVEMEGITHYVTTNTTDIKELSEEEIKIKANEIIKDKKLDKYPAAGVMWLDKTNTAIQMIPVVYVRDIDTLFYETACGSGTTAVGLILAQEAGTSITDIPILQPSGLPIKVSVDYDGAEFKYAQIKGPVQKLKTSTLEMVNGLGYVIEQVETGEELDTLLNESNLVSLYQEVFADPPYEEVFTPDEVREYFENYFTNGKISIARDGTEIIGFAVTEPVTNDEKIAELAETFNIPIGETAYMAELGVSKKYRRKDIGTNLVRKQIDAVLDTNVLLRTAANNEAAKKLYAGLGFIQVDNMTQCVWQTRTDGEEEADERIFMLYKK